MKTNICLLCDKELDSNSKHSWNIKVMYTNGHDSCPSDYFMLCDKCKKAVEKLVMQQYEKCKAL